MMIVRLPSNLWFPSLNFLQWLGDTLVMQHVCPPKSGGIHQHSSTILEGLGHQSGPGLWSWLVNLLNPQVLGLPPKNSWVNYRQLHPQLRELKPISINHQWTNIYIICKRRYIANKREIKGIQPPHTEKIRQDSGELTETTSPVSVKDGEFWVTIWSWR